MIDKNYFFTKLHAQRITNSRHQRLKTAKPHTHHSRFFPCGSAHGKPFTYRHGKSIH
jgi:hypothetical protein